MMSPILMLSLPGYSDYEAFPKTAAWLEKMKTLPYYKEVNEEGLQMLTNWYKSKLAETKK